MDRKGQLANVAFGGAWSEQIAGQEALRDAMRSIEAAARETLAADLRHDNSKREALELLAAEHPKGPMLIVAWEKAVRIENPGLRAAELARIAGALRAGIGKRFDAPPGPGQERIAF